jgi:ribosome maturation factor RimP
VDVEALVRPVIERAGFEFVEAKMTREDGRRTLRLTVDRPEGPDLDSLAELSVSVSRQLDDEGFEPGGTYALEVSSPGIERPLRGSAQFRRAVGSQVEVRTTSPAGSSRVSTGVLLRADDEGIALEGVDGELRVPYEEIDSARTVADWGAELKRSNA